jgi:hypothetical protein
VAAIRTACFHVQKLHFTPTAYLILTMTATFSLNSTNRLVFVFTARYELILDIPINLKPQSLKGLSRIFSPTVLNEAPRHESLWGIGTVAPSILKLSTT